MDQCATKAALDSGVDLLAHQQATPHRWVLIDQTPGDILPEFPRCSKEPQREKMQVLEYGGTIVLSVMIRFASEYAEYWINPFHLSQMSLRNDQRNSLPRQEFILMHT